MLALVLPGAVAILVLLTLNLNKAVEVDARARAEQFADLLQAGLTLPLWNVAIDTGRPLLSAVVADTSVADVEVRDADGEMLLEFHRRRDKPSAMIEIKRTITKDTERLGEVKLYYSTASAQGEAWQSAWVVAGVVTSQFVASMLLIGIWLHRRVLRPLYRLHDSAAAITAGDLHTTLPTLRPDEFGALAKQLDFMRASLAQSVEALEERVNARTAEVQHANSELQSAMDHLQKTQERLIQTEKLASLGSLVAGVAHELNTPIGNGVLVLSTLASQAVEFQSKMAAGLTRSQLDHFVAQVQEGANIGLSSLNRAAELIQDFKQMAVDQTSLRRRRFDLQQVVSETIATISVVYKNSPVRCEIEVPAGIQMESHPGAISQIVSNLYDNAMIHAFANRSGLISITAERRDDQVLVRIADNGTGIAPENLGRIFDPFYTTRLGSGGSGLGLSIVYGLVSGLLGGHIEVTSEWGNGTCFSMVLPRVAPIHEDAQPSQ
jgi:signal transduction histidine kinase